MVAQFWITNGGNGFAITNLTTEFNPIQTGFPLPLSHRGGNFSNIVILANSFKNSGEAKAL